MKQPLCITFAGTPGSSKTPTAYYLSWHLGLPIFNNDAIRTEVQEDTLQQNFETDDYLARRDERLNKLITSGRSFILDASVDRTWKEVKEKLDQHNYDWHVISFDLSKEFLLNIARAKGYSQDRGLWDKWYSEHRRFLADFASDVALSISDETFPDRLELCLKNMQPKV